MDKRQNTPLEIENRDCNYMIEFPHIVMMVRSMPKLIPLPSTF